MTETELIFPTEGIALEARLVTGSQGELAVICHPHPLYGGSMDNNVVLAARDGLARAGFSTLRFNFRGVGGSGGEPGTDSDPDDLSAMLEHLARQEVAARGLHVAAYSYGAWVALSSLGKSPAPASMLLFSPPVDFMPFEALRLPEAPCLITLGSRDEYCSEASLRQWFDRQPESEATRQVVVFPGGDHFYGGQEAALEEAIGEFLISGV